MTADPTRDLSPLQQKALATASPDEVAKVTQWLAERGQGVTPHGIAGELLALRDHAEKMARIHALRKTIDGSTGLRAARLVKACVDKYGTGPTRHELAQGMGWDGSARQMIHALAQQGWLEFGEEPRSLRPGPRATDPSWRPCKTKPHKGGATKKKEHAK